MTRLRCGRLVAGWLVNCSQPTQMKKAGVQASAARGWTFDPPLA